MGNIFSYDSPLGKILSKLFDWIALSFIAFICCIPLFTIGATISSLYFIFTKEVTRGEGETYKEFFVHFKKNFKKATIVWLILFVCFVITTTNLNILSSELVSGIDPIILIFVQGIQIAVLIEIVFIFLYVFPIIARFDLSIKNSIKSSFLLANKYLLHTVIMLVILVLLTFVTYIFLWFAGIYYIVFINISSYIFVKIFRKVRKDFEPEE